MFKACGALEFFLPLSHHLRWVRGFVSTSARVKMKQNHQNNQATKVTIRVLKPASDIAFSLLPVKVCIIQSNNTLNNSAFQSSPMNTIFMGVTADSGKRHLHGHFLQWKWKSMQSNGYWCLPSSWDKGSFNSHFYNPAAVERKLESKPISEKQSILSFTSPDVWGVNTITCTSTLEDSILSFIYFFYS